MTFNFKKKSAFTLAETLITLAIIGIIAALTVPNLLKKYQHHIWATQLIKTYSELQDAYRMIPTSHNCANDDYLCAGFKTRETPKDVLANLFYENLKNYKDCRNGSCLKSSYKTTGYDTALTNNEANGIWGTATIKSTSDWNKIIISPSGALVTFGPYNRILVDLNGPKGPNLYGRDVFHFHIRPDDNQFKYMIIPFGSLAYKKATNSSWYWKTSNRGCNLKHLTELCTGRVLEERAMKY